MIDFVPKMQKALSSIPRIRCTPQMQMSGLVDPRKRIREIPSSQEFGSLARALPDIQMTTQDLEVLIRSDHNYEKKNARFSFFLSFCIGQFLLNLKSRTACIFRKYKSSLFTFNTAVWK